MQVPHHIDGIHLWYLYHQYPYRSPACIQSGGFYQSQAPVVDARALKVKTNRDELKSVVNKNLQATSYGVLPSLASFVTVGTVGDRDYCSYFSRFLSARYTQLQG